MNAVLGGNLLNLFSYKEVWDCCRPFGALSRRLNTPNFAVLFVFILLLSGFSSQAQTTIWSEDFNSYTDGTQQGSGTPPKWSISPTSGYTGHFEVRSPGSQVLVQGNDMDQEGVFTSQVIDISLYSNVVITVNIAEQGNAEVTDYIKLYYDLDGGGETLFETNGDNTGNFGSRVASTNAINGSSLTIIIKVLNNNGNENHRFDDVLVEGTLISSAPTCSSPISPTDGATGVDVGASLTWNTVSEATSYDVYLEEANTDPQFIANVSGTTYTPQVGFNPLTTYYWKVIPKNFLGSASGCSIWSFTTADISYCTSSGNMVYATAVTLVSLRTINNPTGKDAAYTDYTSTQSTDLVVGDTYDLTVNLNTDGDYQIYAIAWIDWNQDGNFDDAGGEFELGFTEDSSDGITDESPLSITVPSGAKLGNTRMRVSAKWADYPTSCEEDFDGEVEDYSINVVSSCAANVFNVTGGGAYCSDDGGVAVGLDDSETGVNYELYRDAVALGITEAGTGSALNFGLQTVTGTYTVVGHHVADDCDVTMNGSTIVTAIPSPTLTGASQAADICGGSPATINLTGLAANSTFTLNYSIDGNAQTPITGLIADGSGNSSFPTSNLLASDNGKTLEVTEITITGSTLNCSKSFTGISTVLTVLPSEVNVSISATPSGSVCPGTTVAYTATSSNGGTAPSYQWKVNGTNVGTDSNTFTYEPADGDEISCILTSNSPCATSSASVPILFFSWDDDTKDITDSDYGLDAISVDPGAHYNTGTLAPGPASSGSQGVDLTFSGAEPELNFAGLEYSIDYRRGEGQAEMFTRGLYLVITSGSNFSVSYRISDGAGSFTTVNSGNVYAIPEDGNFHNYRFRYNPQDGIGRLIVDDDEKWQSTPTPGQPFYWDGATGDNLLVGKFVDASGNEFPTFDNLSMKVINEKTAGDTITVIVNPLVEPTLSSNSPICSGDDAVFTITGTSGNVVTYTGASGSPVTIGAGGTTDVTVSEATSDVILNLTNVSDGTCNLPLNVSLTVTVNVPPTAGITNNTGETELTCTTAAISLTATGGGTYSWSDGTNVVGTNAALSVTTPATYTVTVTTANGCKATESITITQDITPPTVTANASETNICLGESVTLTGGGAVSYTWDSGVTDGVAFTPTETKIYTVTGTGANGCTSTAQVTVTVTPLPTAVISGDATICEGSSTTISVVLTGTAPWEVTTQRDGGDDITVMNIPASPYTFNVTAAGTYTVNAVSDDNCTGTASGSAVVIVNALPTAAVLSTNSPICENENAEFILAGTSGATVTYKINTGSEETVVLTSGTATLTISSATENQTLNLVSIADANCSQLLGTSSTIIVNPLPVIGSFNQ